MNPTTPALKHQKSLLFLLIGGLVIIIALAILSRGSHTPFILTQTPFRDTDNFSYLEGDELYSFNGLAFYKVRMGDGTVTTLSAGTKLPMPGSVYWANDKGALMSFDGSFIATPIERYLRERNIEINEVTQSYVWYFDFAGQTIHLVSRVPILDESVLYAEDDGGFYYSPNLSFVESDEVNPVVDIYFFDIATKKNTRLASGIRAIDVQGTTECDDDAYRLCFVARNADDPTTVQLFTVATDNTIATPLETKGRIITTSNPNLFITTELFDDRAEQEGEREIVDIEPMPADLYDLRDGSRENMGIEIGGEAVIASINSHNDYRLILEPLQSPGTETTYHSATRNYLGFTTHKDIPLTYPDGTAHTEGFVSPAGFGSGGRILLSDGTDQLLVFTPESAVPVVEAPDQERVVGVLEDCGQGRMADRDYYDDPSLYRLFFIDDANFSRKIEAFGSCVAQTDNKVFVGNNYYLGGQSALNGRITTD